MIAICCLILTAVTILKYESSKLDIKIKEARDLKNKLNYDLSFLKAEWEYLSSPKNIEKLSNVQDDKYITVKEFKVPKSSKINHINVEDCNFSDNDLLIISVPSPSLEKNLSLIKNKINDSTQIISASKGFDKNGNTLSVLIKNKLNISSENIGVLSGLSLIHI